ncbi:MAG: type ISP restriction/modification enzyme [Anaerolineae bacterium]
MTQAAHKRFRQHLSSYAQALTDTYALPVPFAPEDQLKPAVAALLGQAGELLDRAVQTVTEARAPDHLGQPDIGVTTDGLLAGYIELKAPGKGANPDKLSGRDADQWKRFQALPNLIYTDGNAWALYRSGERVGNVVMLSGDVTQDGSDAATAHDAAALLALLRDFVNWEPIAPSSPRALADTLAPICRLLRDQVEEVIQDPDANLTSLAADWRRYLFPQADDRQFADAYAQTLTYALLLARISGAQELDVRDAADALRPGHRLLADALRILGDEAAHQEIAVPADLLRRIIGAVDLSRMDDKPEERDLWLYFYEDFLAAYDPKMRKERGVFYTPVPVVQAQVRLVDQLLRERLAAPQGFVDPSVTTLDPACGTGTYLLTAVEHGLDRVAESKGQGMRASYATTAGANVHGFELLVGPYAVAHLRLTQLITGQGGTLPADGARVYLTDTLESPHTEPPPFPLLYRALGQEHERARHVKAETPVVVCIGNPPYEREQTNDADARRKGGWVRYGDPENGRTTSDTLGILADFIEPLSQAGLGLHAKNLYNDYVYFWRWALWKVLESNPGPGIVSFITASSYLRGPGFAGMRQHMRQLFDDLWIIDLEGDNLGARKTENVFAIRSPVAIAIGVRYGDGDAATPAQVRYTRLEGTREDKLATLSQVHAFADLDWRPCLAGWLDPFLPTSDKPYWDWPLLTDLFPWQENGMQFKRTWPIAPSRELLERRWTALLHATNRRVAFKETRDRKVTGSYPMVNDPTQRHTPIAQLHENAPPPAAERISYRSFDRQWALIDSRLGDYLRPGLQRAHGPQQVYLTSLLSEVLGEGPAATSCAHRPDMHHFRGSFGSKHVIPLWRDPAATSPNIVAGLLEQLGAAYGAAVSPEDLFAYAYAVLFSPRYVRRFWDELTIPGPRLPLTKDSTTFQRAASLGRRLLWLHTYGERYVPPGERRGVVPPGRPRCAVGTPTTPDAYPEDYGYDTATEELHVGKAVFTHVRQEVWEFSVSGLQVVKSWLDYRKRNPRGRRSSPLDDILPEVWTFDEELLDLLWVLDHTVDLLPDVNAAFEAVAASDLFRADELPQPTEAERQGPSEAMQHSLDL